MLRLFRKIFRTQYESLNKIELSRPALLRNYQTIAKIASIPVAPVLKSNAYGHGIREIGAMLDSYRPPFFCVDSLYEGYELMKEKIRTPVLIMGYVNPENLRVKKLPFSYAVYDIGTLRAIARHQPHAGIHIFVDTGMHREGIPVEHLEDFLRDMPRARIEGLMSHLAYGGDPDHPFTRRQIERFSSAKEILNAWGIEPAWTHIAASSALLVSPRYKNMLGNLGRAGLALYGVAEKRGVVSPVLRFSTTLVQVKSVKKGERIGYDFSFVAERDMKIGVLPVGYNDGVDLRLSGKGSASLRRRQCPFVGKISMNLSVVDVSAVPDAHPGDEVVVFSHHENDPNSILSASRACETIPYELLVHLHPSTKRVPVF